MNIYSIQPEDEIFSDFKEWSKNNPVDTLEFITQKIPGQAYFTGLKHSEETKEKMRQAHLGKPKPPISEEHKQKISQGNLGRKRPPRTDEWKRKQSLAQTGIKRKPFTEEHKQKLKDAKKRTSKHNYII